MTLIHYPDPLVAFLEALEATHPAVKYAIERGGDVAGNWWVDIAGPSRLAVEYRPTQGFGLYWGDGVYGDGANEVVTGPEIAAQRIGELIDHPPLS